MIDGESKIIHGDCIDILSKLPSSSIDLIITSPPYNTGKSYENNLTIEEYKEFAKRWVCDVPRIVKNNGSFWLNVGYIKIGPNEALPLTYIYYPLIQMKLIQEIVWHYEGGMSYKKRFTHRTERWMWFSHNPDQVNFYLDQVRDLSLNLTTDKRNHPLGKNPTDLWSFNRVVSGTGKVKEKTSHPCQFPEKMIERIILSCSKEGDLILDPFVGSGTTAVVAKKLGRRYLGIEKEIIYVQEAEKRLK